MTDLRALKARVEGAHHLVMEAVDAVNAAPTGENLERLKTAKHELDEACAEADKFFQEADKATAAFFQFVGAMTGRVPADAGDMFR